MKDTFRFTEPSHRYHPGINERPTGGPVADIAHAATCAACLETQAAQCALHYGLFLIDRRYFWEAHEVLEPVWMLATPNSCERYLVQSFIQVANACLKSDMGRGRAASRLIALARQHAREASHGASSTVLGISAPDTLRMIEAVHADLSSGVGGLSELKFQSLLAL